MMDDRARFVAVLREVGELPPEAVEFMVSLLGRHRARSAALRSMLDDLSIIVASSTQKEEERR